MARTDYLHFRQNWVKYTIVYTHDLHHAEVSICYIYLIKSTKGKSIKLCAIALIKILPEMTISIGQFWLKLL